MEMLILGLDIIIVFVKISLDRLMCFYNWESIKKKKGSFRMDGVLDYKSQLTLGLFSNRKAVLETCVTCTFPAPCSKTQWVCDQLPVSI